jgi:GAF domain-containing protein/CheY-like chemotaxis protein/anti-sigma regulatory factor (Ser/Thr protein kinase)
VAREAGRAEALVDEAGRQLEREARILAADPAVVEGTGRGDWGTLARGASPRMLSLTIDRLADLLLIVDAHGAPLVQVPAPARSPIRAVSLPAPSLQVFNDRSYVVAVAPVRSSGAEGPGPSAGFVLAGRSVESLGRALSTGAGRVALVVLDGERAIASTLPGARPAPGAIARGSLVAGGEPWIARPLTRAGGLALVALVSDAARSRERGWLWAWLAGTLALALGGVGAAAWSVRAVPPRGPAGAPAADWKSARLETLAQMTLTATLALDEVLQRVVDSAVELFGAKVAGLWLMEDDGRYVSLRAGAGAVALMDELRRMPVDGGMIGPMVKGREATSIDVATDGRPRHPERLRAVGIVSVAAAPLCAGERVLGLVGIGAAERHDYSAEELDLLQALANRAAAAIETARRFSAERTRRTHLSALLDINTKIGAMAPTETLLTSIAEEAMRLLDVDNAGFRLLEGDDLVLAGLAAGAGAALVRPRIKRGESFSGKVVAQGRTLASDIESLPDLAPEHRAAHRALGYTTLLGVPLRVGDRTIGALMFCARRPFTALDQELAESFAGQAAIAIEHSRLYRETARSAERMTALADLGRLLSETLDPDVVGQRIVDSVRSLFGVQNSALLRLSPESGDLEVMSVAEGRPTLPPGTIFVRGTGTSGFAVRARQPVIAPDLLSDPRFSFTPDLRSRIEDAGYRSVLTLPLMVRDTVIGALSLGDAAGRVFDDEEVRLARAFADQAALALDNARLFSESARRRREAEELARVAQTLTGSLDVEAVGERIVERVLPLFGAKISGLRLLEPDGSLVLVAVGGEARSHFERGHVQLAGEGFLSVVAARGTPLTTPDLLADPRFTWTDNLRARITETGHRAMLAVPLRVQGRIIGVLYIATLAARAFSDAEVALLQAFGDQAALALENARLYAETSRRLDETRALLEVAEILNSTLDARQLLKSVAIKIAQVCRVERCSIERWEDGRVVVLVSQFADGRPRPEMWAAYGGSPSWTPREARAYARAIETRRPVVIGDTANTDLIPREWIERYSLKSSLVVPLTRQDQVIGFMSLDHTERPTPFSPGQVDLAMAIAGQLALSLENTRLYAEARERLWETTTLVAVGQALSQSGPTVDVMRHVAREVTRAFGADTTGLYVFDAGRDHLVPLAGHHVPKDLLESFLTRPIRVAPFAALLEPWREGRAIWSGDHAHDPRFAGDWATAFPPHSLLFAAALSRGEPVGGLFIVWWGTGREFRPSEIRLVEAIAAQIGLAFENLELARQTEIKLRETEILLSVSHALSTTLDQDALLRHFLRRMAAVLEADTVGIWVVDESGERLEPLAGYRVPPESVSRLRATRLSLAGNDFYGEAARTRRPVFSRDVTTDPRVPAMLRDVLPHRAHLFVPMIVKDRMIGGLAAVWWERVREFSESELALTEAIANQAGVTLENLRLFQENRRQVNELSVLYDLSRAVTGQLDQDALVRAVETHVARVLDAQNFVLVLRNPDPQGPEMVYATLGGRRRFRNPEGYGRPGKGLISVVLESGRPLRTDDYLAECATHGVTPVGPDVSVRHVVLVPMKIGETVLGALALGSQERAFTAADERLLTNIADLAALALASARLFDERARAFRDLAAAQDQLVRTEKLRALGEMASGIAHDFNNLLASILGRAQLLLEHVQDAQLVRWLQVIERAALDGAQTVRGLQEFTRVRRDEPLVPVDLNQVITDALEMTQSRWRDEPQSRGVSVEVRSDLAPLPPVAGDAAGLREVFTNLILNAVDAMPAGGTLSLSTLAANGQVDVVVADTGVGMPESVREKIFDPFFTTKGPQGTGLGLSMTYGIVSRHGATIGVESREGAGATFRLTFPLAPEASGPPPEVPGEPSPPRALRCLVVDDEEVVGTVIGDVLRINGHHAVVLQDGAAAIERFRTEPFDVVFTDLAMPGVSGWQVIHAVKVIAPAVPVFLVTGFGVELSAEERRMHGVEAVLVKPLTIDTLLNAVAQAARMRGQIGGPEDRG